MRAPPPSRTAPRTLAHAPPTAPLRTPRPSAYEARFPALAVVLASGVALPACHDPECGDARADELERHGENSLRNVTNGRVTDGLRELGVALGLVAHDRTTVPEVHSAGAAPAVQPTPPPVAPPANAPEDPVLAPSGSVSVTSPAPLPPRPPPAVRTTPAGPHGSPGVRGARRPVAPTPTAPPTAPQGGEARVSPLPADGVVLTRA